MDSLYKRGGDNPNSEDHYTLGSCNDQIQKQVFTKTVTEIKSDFGMAGGDTFFLKSVVKGPLPKAGDRVLVEAEPLTGMPFKFVAKRLQLLSRDPDAVNYDCEEQSKDRKVANIPTVTPVYPENWSLTSRTLNKGIPNITEQSSLSLERALALKESLEAFIAQQSNSIDKRYESLAGDSFPETEDPRENVGCQKCTEKHASCSGTSQQKLIHKSLKRKESTTETARLVENTFPNNSLRKHVSLEPKPSTSKISVTISKSSTKRSIVVSGGIDLSTERMVNFEERCSERPPSEMYSGQARPEKTPELNLNKSVQFEDNFGRSFTNEEVLRSVDLPSGSHFEETKIARMDKESQVSIGKKRRRSSNQIAKRRVRMTAYNAIKQSSGPEIIANNEEINYNKNAQWEGNFGSFPHERGPQSVAVSNKPYFQVTKIARVDEESQISIRKKHHITPAKSARNRARMGAYNAAKSSTFHKE